MGLRFTVLVGVGFVTSALLMAAINNQSINNRLKFVSYNCRGLHDSKKDYLENLLSQCDILFLQEHWLTDVQIQSLNLINSNFSAFGISGFDQAEILRGRPYGGCAIFWKQNLNVTVSFIDSSSRRVCAIRCNFDFGSLLLINVYMPYEKDYASYDDFRLHLSVIDDIIERNADCHVILGGDFNVDFGRERDYTLICWLTFARIII
jgi:exonuclease III